MYLQLKDYKGSARLDIREFFLRGRENDDEKTPSGCFDDEKGGIWQFTGKGISLNAEMLDEFVEKVTALAT